MNEQLFKIAIEKGIKNAFSKIESFNAKETCGPEPGNLPAKGAHILAKVYASCIKDGGSEEKCSKIA